jgi:DNA repair protein RadD
METKMIVQHPYQRQLTDDIYQAWDAYKNVLAVLPPGGGKTVIFSDIVRKHPGPSMVIVHRQELVSQISLSLANSGVYHNIIAPDNIIRWICSTHCEMHGGEHFYDPKSETHVAGVDTLIRRAHKSPKLCKAITLWVLDEGHHLTRANKWGKAVRLFPNAKGLGVTATALRGDGRGLGLHADGYYEVIVEGPHTRGLIDQGHLSEYMIYSRPADIDFTKVPVTGTGDYSGTKLKTETRKSPIVGDIVKSYLQFTPGKRGVTFVPDVETAEDVAGQFRRLGVPAASVHAKTHHIERQKSISKLASGRLLNLVNVDIFGEGFNLPTIEVVSMARATWSYGLFKQQFGRVLRTSPGKEYGYIIDHVGNILDRHGLPDYGRDWSLDRAEKRSANKDPDTLPLKACLKCFKVYEGYGITCPYCGSINAPAQRSKPEFVEGDLTLLDPDVLKKLRGEIDRVNSPASAMVDRLRYSGLSGVALAGAVAQHEKRRDAQALLQNVISTWAGVRRANGTPDAESYREFWHRFGTDVYTAQTLGRPGAEKLTETILQGG